MRGWGGAGRWRFACVTEVALVEEVSVREVDVDVDVEGGVGGGGGLLVFWVAVEEGLGCVSAGEGWDRSGYV